MKKQIAFLLALGMSLALFTSCGKKTENKEQDTTTEQTTEKDTGSEQDTGSDTNTDSDTGSDTGSDTTSEHTHNYDALGNCTLCEESLSTTVTFDGSYYGIYNATVNEGKVYLNYTAVCTAGGFYVDLSQLDGCNADPDLAVKCITDIAIYEEGTTTNLIKSVNKYHDGDSWCYLAITVNFEIGKTYYAVIDLENDYKEDTIELCAEIDCLSHHYEGGVCGNCNAKKVEENANYGAYTGTTKTVAGRGTVIDVLIKKGTFKSSTPENEVNVTLVKADGETVVFKSVITGLEYDETLVQSAVAGERVGVLIRGLDAETDLTQVKYVICE